jgi:hypothetical protein
LAGSAPIYKVRDEYRLRAQEAPMVVSSRLQKPEAKINSGEIFVGLVWLVSYVVIISTGLWRDAGPLVATVDLTGLI